MMKILFVTAFLPMDFGSGSAMRSYQLYKALEKAAHVDVVSANNWPIKQDVLNEFEGNYLGHVTIPGRGSYLRKPKPLSSELQALVDLEEYDFVFSRYYNPAFWLGLFDLDNLILDCDDCILEMLENEYRDNKRNIVKRTLSYLRHRVFKDRYLESLEIPRACIYSRHSQYSKALTNAVEIPNRLSATKSVIPLGDQTAQKNKTVLFVGVLNYGPNIDGLNHFLDYIWPGVLAELPETRLTIVGANAKKHNEHRWKKVPNVDFMGYVRSIEEAYLLADVCVVPVYRGGGVHIKIMEAFKYGKPVVMSDEAQRGYQNKIKDGQHAFIAKTDEEFILKLNSLLANETTRKSVSQQASEIFHREFSIDSDDPTIKNILNAPAASA